jgi:hypothetical protein
MLVQLREHFIPQECAAMSATRNRHHAFDRCVDLVRVALDFRRDAERVARTLRFRRA